MPLTRVVPMASWGLLEAGYGESGVKEVERASVDEALRFVCEGRWESEEAWLGVLGGCCLVRSWLACRWDWFRVRNG